MSDNGPKIVVLQDYIKARGLLKQEDIEALLAKQRIRLRLLDMKVAAFPLMKHKLKDARSAKAKSAESEFILAQAMDWLEDKIVATTDEKDKEAKQLLFKQCEQLMARNERIKKNIADDFAASRFEILRPLTIAGFLGGTPITAANLARLLTDNPRAILWAAIIGAALGAYLAFHYHARTVGEFARDAIVKSPRQFRFLKKSARNSAVAAALRVSVAAKQVNEIELHYPARSARGSRLVIVANIKN